ncbi:MAG: DUF58 domain-containing protein [Eubacterium sp.]|nr:DUF58 domain-containing protein [Eubacterium sp.]
MKLFAGIIIFTLIYILQKLLYMKFWDRNLEASLSFDRDYIECGEKADLIEVVSNDKMLPLPVFHLRFSVDRSLIFDDVRNSSVTDLYHKNEVFSILGHQRITRKLSFKGTSRGVVVVNNASISVHDFFMVSTYAMSIKSVDSIYVFPEKIHTERFKMILKGIIGELEAKKSIIEDSLTFRGIRDYQSFDPYRSINWKQSAKAQDLMVNVYNYTTDCRVRIMLDLDNDYMIETDRLLEEAIRLASSISRQLIARGIGVSVVSNGTTAEGKPLADVEYGSDLKHGITIDKMLCEIAGSESKDRFLDYVNDEINNVRKDMLYLIISPYTRDDLMTLLDRLESKGGVVQMLVPCYDEYPYVSNRAYSQGWEVPINV